MNEVRCVGIIPAEQSVCKGQSLNVLVMAISDAAVPVRCNVRVYGSVGTGWVLLTWKDCELSPGEHAHLYLNIPARCFTAEFWNGEEPEELSICPGLTTPSPAEPGVLVFCDT